MTLENLGAPVRADAGAIEEELRSFWKVAAERGEGLPAVRACSCTIIATAASEREASDIAAVLGRVSEYHPSRGLIVCPEEGRTGDLRAWLGAQCLLPSGEGSPICSETVTLAGPAHAIQFLRNVVLSLVVPDLPVFLYRRAPGSFDEELAADLSRVASRQIVDSAGVRSGERRRRLLQLLSAPGGGPPVRDLDWGRLTIWRDLIAQCFDGARTRALVDRIAEVVIERNTPCGETPYRSFLLVAWMASRLDWERLSSASRAGEWSSRWRSPSGVVSATLRNSADLRVDPPGLLSVLIRTRDGSRFVVAREPENPCLRAMSLVGGEELVHSVPVPSPDESDLLAQEMSLPDDDAEFAPILAECLRLAEEYRDA